MTLTGLAMIAALAASSDVRPIGPTTRVRAGPPEGRLTLAARTSFLFVNFNRPPRACGGTLVGAFCPAEDSNESAMSVGLGLGFRIRGPVHLTWGLDVGFTDPEFDVLDPQVMIQMPFGVLLTWDQWTVRPIIEGVAVPFVLLPDGVKSVMFGGRGGLAVRFGDIDLSLTAGYAVADELRPFELRLSLLHLPSPG